MTCINIVFHWFSFIELQYVGFHLSLQLYSDHITVIVLWYSVQFTDTTFNHIFKIVFQQVFCNAQTKGFTYQGQSFWLYGRAYLQFHSFQFYFCFSLKSGIYLFCSISFQTIRLFNKARHEELIHESITLHNHELIQW